MKHLFALLLWLCSSVSVLAQENVLYFANWSDYLPQAIIDQFQQQTGIQVVYTTYDSNETLYAKLKMLDSSGYDLVVPSSYFVNKMVREQMLYPLDKDQLTNLRHLDPKLLDWPYDPKNRYSVPYFWGSTGIVFDASLIDPAKVTGWADLWRPEFRNQLLLLNDQRDVFAIGLRVLGYSINSTKPAEIEAAYQKLRLLRPNIRLFTSESAQTPLLTGEVSIAVVWNGQAFLASQENPNIRYVYPKEGAGLWVDSLVIPKNAKHPQAAHQMINFLLQPEIAKQLSEAIGYATPNKAAWQLLAPEIRNNKTIYPDEADLAQAEFQLDIGEAILDYQKYWEQLKLGQ